jgi:hypothetical protein
MFALLGTEASGSDETPVGREWDALAERILHSALLTYSSEFISALSSVLARAPSSTQNRWRAVLRARVVRDRLGCPTCGAGDPLVFALGDSGGTCGGCGAPLAGPMDLLLAPELDVLRAQQTSEIKAGADTDLALDAALRNLLRVARHVVVLDRFAIADARRSQERGLRSALIETLGRSFAAGVAKATVVATMADGRGTRHAAEEVRELFLGLFTDALPGRVRLVVIHPALAKRKLHDRWLGFYWSDHGGATFALGKGIGQFDGRRVAQTSTWARQSDRLAAALLAELSPQALLDETFVP